MRRMERQLEFQQILEILKDASFGDLAFLDHGRPAVVPLSFGFQQEEKRLAFFFHCAPEGRKIEALRANPAVSFSVVSRADVVLVEPACRSTMHYAGVIADGEISELTTPAEKAAALDLIMNHYGAAGHFDYPAPMLERTAILKLTVSSITGKSNCR
ncbi:pyridoxamine 5'-phosphate oxidase family protein [Victivallis vadensis]|uniref:pyridoxamine 5'-phosphate oxidase family protein n=1 Tax=Victivallis vadensis TaxID=172901 RepID=UPI0026731DCD|nr:pyridoxamine 5'-phosphate oxidase family protein [Victivallis vadensis]